MPGCRLTGPEVLPVTKPEIVGTKASEVGSSWLEFIAVSSLSIAERFSCNDFALNCGEFGALPTDEFMLKPSGSDIFFSLELEFELKAPEFGLEPLEQIA